MRIRTQLLLAAACAAVVTLTVLGSLWYVTHRSAANLQAQADGQDIARDVANLLTLTQEYTVYGGERATLQWRARHAQLRQTVAQAVARESDPHPALAEMGRRVADLLPLYERLVEAYREASTDLALRRRELMVERLVSETQELVDARHRWATVLIERQAREQRVAHTIVLMASALLSLLIVGLAFLVYRRGLVPLARLQAAATAIERGDLSTRCDAGTHDELGDTGRAVNAMAESLLAANAALRAAKERYELAVEGADQGLWDWDLTNNVQFVSPRAQELLGRAPGETLRPRAEWMARVTLHPDDVAAVRAATSAHLRGESRHFQVEYRMRHQSGDWHWYRQRGIALRDAGGRPYRMAGSVEDITAQKNAEEERLRLERQLLQAKKLEAIGSLAGGIAHDFNNILAAILGNGEMAQAEAPKGTPLRRHVDAVVTAGARAKSLVERILAFSRSGMGDRSAVHVQSVVDEALHLVATSLPRHLQLDRELAAGDACVLGDATQIHQVVMNLCTNAVQAMKSSGSLGVALDVVERSDAVMATSALPSGRYVRLRVRDTGTGIPAAALDRIFDPFFTTKDVGVGTGLGLSLVLRIVTDLGGGIEVDSKVGAGTTFTVYLPWHSSLAPALEDEEVPANGTGETILLVDDEEMLVRLGEEMIARLGYEPVGFTSSVAALEAVRAEPERFHAVLSDEAMPEMTGVELAKEIRALRADIPIVLMSGFVSSALVNRAHGCGITEVLAKPLVARDIARCLAGALSPAAANQSDPAGQRA